MSSSSCGVFPLTPIAPITLASEAAAIFFATSSVNTFFVGRSALIGIANDKKEPARVYNSARFIAGLVGEMRRSLQPELVFAFTIQVLRTNVTCGVATRWHWQHG